MFRHTATGTALSSSGLTDTFAITMPTSPWQFMRWKCFGVCVGWHPALLICLERFHKWPKMIAHYAQETTSKKLPIVPVVPSLIIMQCPRCLPLKLALAATLFFASAILLKFQSMCRAERSHIPINGITGNLRAILK